MSTPTPPAPQPQQSYAQPPAPAQQGWQQPAQGGYTSPIPIVRTHLGHALTSEWTKIKSVRSTMWTISVFVALVVGIGLLVAAQTDDADYADVPYSIPAFFGLILGQICLITLGVLVVSSEYGTGMIRTTFTASPQRYRVLTAKFLIFFAVAFTTCVISIGLVGLAASGMHADASEEPWLGTVFKGSLYVSLLGVLALAVGSMLRHSAGAITAMLGVVLVPAIMPAFLMIADSTRSFGEKMNEYNAPSSLAMIFRVDAESGDTGNPQLFLLIGLTAAAVAGAYALLEKRDV
ncbi:ABC transporter permease subunit [Streptomyces sp. NA04227]|uniref:ABC transporter permease n=1 Tax=Streptomyces sp. NA04227 TaxID=2742136 RepID=UPI0015926957|nr:ABC transporter permease subunit [Streptomyces sp. NA04227]QKW09206.1 ABC transporter permease subunit [Streptomyces sp. NA04227]